MVPENIDIHHRSPTGAKITLFRSLFRGRGTFIPAGSKAARAEKVVINPPVPTSGLWAFARNPRPSVPIVRKETSFLSLMM
jgi:hypothetical protein